MGKLEFRTNTRTTGVCGGKVSSTDWTNKGEFSFEIWYSLYADDAGVMHSSRADLVAGAEAIDAHLKLFGLLMRGPRGRRRLSSRSQNHRESFSSSSSSRGADARGLSGLAEVLFDL